MSKTRVVPENSRKKPIASAAGDQKDNAGQGAQVVEYCVLMLRLEQLEVDEKGRLTEAPRALEILATARGAIMRDLKGVVECGESKISPGSYQIDLNFFGSIQRDLLGTSTYSEEWISTLRLDCSRVTSNATLTKPDTADALGLSDARVELLWALAVLGEEQLTLTLAQVDRGNELQIPLPSLTEMRALPKKAKASQRVSGKLTAVGLDKKEGCRIEVNFRTLACAPDIEVDHALMLFQKEAFITANLDEIEGVATFRSVQFSMPTEKLFD